MATTAWQCDEARGPLAATEIDIGAPAADEVEIAIEWCGLCHSDLHLIDNDWGTDAYPLVPGHEVIGRISAVGGQVSDLAVGDSAGVGWQSDSCRQCEYCEAGEENICTRVSPTCVGRPGGFAERIRVPARFVFRIPEGMHEPATAPLLCGGITVFAPLIRNGIGPGSRVAIAGYGGLGHLALRFAVAMGAEVTMISNSADKRDAALADGAAEFMLFDDCGERKQHARAFDFMLSTISANRPWQDYLAMLKPHGTLCMVGAPPEPLQIRAGALIGGQKAVAGSAIGGSRDMRKMLDFAARHDVSAQVEVLPASRINDAIDKLRGGNVRYRMVLEMMNAG